MMNKQLLVEAALVELQGQLIALKQAAEATRAGATHAESRAESDKDTRGLEASYLARGQAQRVAGTEEVIKRLRFLELMSFELDQAIALSAVVHLAVEDRDGHYFLVPAGGGLTVQADGTQVQLLNVTSPLGRALIGRCTGEAFEMRLQGREQDFEILGAW